MNLRFIDWIWHVRGSLPLAQGQNGADAFDRLDPLFRQNGTSHKRTTDALTFTKTNQAAQDKMSIFDSGVLRVQQGPAGKSLHYDLMSRALLFCFLAPLLFIGFAQLTVALNKIQKPATEAANPAPKKAQLPMNPIDKALGAPAPEAPGKDGAEAGGKRSKKPTPTAAYVFAAIFAALYLVGRILEDRLVRRLFMRSLGTQDLTAEARNDGILEAVSAGS